MVTSSPFVPARICLSLFGYMAMCTYVTSFACPCFRCPQLCLQRACSPTNHSMDLLLTVPFSVPFPHPSFSPCFQWWKNQFKFAPGYPSFSLPHAQWSLQMYRSAHGLAPDTRNLDCSGIQHALGAARRVCCAFLPSIHSRRGVIMLDDTTTVYYSNKQGGTKSPALRTEAVRLWNWCISHTILLSAAYLPRTQNMIADSLSRKFVTNHNWELLQLCGQ